MEEARGLAVNACENGEDVTSQPVAARLVDDKISPTGREIEEDFEEDGSQRSRWGSDGTRSGYQ
ncbi:hypothetical protein PIB30_049576 [Stylosanthes scabra]|uniref:Uncharacterized protein n=1 Tax=Stylosanthes scabra TaxID=79078 RepID=A0ABU6TI69_9FABA|nr:hypothetical protein [Stylosanthes scabra]